MTARSLLIFPLLAAFSHAAPVKSGHATAEWITGATAIEGGKPIQTGIRLVIEEGWHSYWINPGESGMKLKVVWDLPEGWTAGEVGHPAPKKFLTGELPGYGYEGEVVFPVTLTPPAGASGSVELGAKVSWLTCNDASCIPGKAELKLSPAAGTAAHAEAIGKARALVPQPLEGLKLDVSETGDAVALTLV
ncbi:MAG: thiol:disulfide interchange protein, partial [Verrucomicrobiaceae bacterium]